ncbi:MAG: transcription antitermination factor NusB [Candidatus Limnocylindrales bacterium]
MARSAQPSSARASTGSDQIRSRRRGRRLALASIFEADFGQRTAEAILERHLAESEGDAGTAEFARLLVRETTADRAAIDARIGRLASQYPVVQLARIDRALLRTALGEVLHSPATPARVAIAEWVELARIYSGDPARRLVNGVLGRLTREAAAATEDSAGEPADDDAGVPAG